MPSNWKYTDISARVVARTLDNGGMQSVMAGSPETFDRLEDGTLVPMIVDPLTPAEIAQQQALIDAVAKLGVDLSAVKADGPIVAFLKMSPSQIDAYIDTNFPGAAAPMPNLRTVLKVYGKVLAVIARDRISQ